MRRTGERPSVEPVLRGLKDFQRDTVEYVFRRLYLDDEPARRFLVADEVGLGKTLVARGLIAKTIDYLWDKEEQVDVTYICSDANIARQNINRLNVTGREDFALASRITLLPVMLRDLKRNRLNFISFTPGTSFDLKSSMGTVEERALLYWLLDSAWSLKGSGPYNLLQGYASRDRFRRAVDEFHRYYEIDPTLSQAFVSALGKREESELKAGEPDIRSSFEELCERCARRKRVPEEDAAARNRVIAELRGLLASTCITALEPDLIILDEFQRFKHLLDGSDSASSLARGLFEYGEARVVMLSATPYKMYTMSHESEEGEDHYQDFLRTYRFLTADPARHSRFEQTLSDYRRELFRLGGDPAARARLLEIKRELERELRLVMVRTERLAVTTDRDGMLVSVTAPTRLETKDLRSYVTLQRVARLVNHGDTMEFWKSAPYLLNFMDKYDLKDSFEGALEDPRVAAELSMILAEGREALLPWRRVASYRDVELCNPRMRMLLEDTVGRGAWRLLWVPPSLDYYAPSGPFADPRLRRFTKRLVFSSWRVVPKAIASLLSYSAERLAILSSPEESPQYSTEARKKRGNLLRFTRADGRLTGMPVLGLLYPSAELARLCDPLNLFKGTGERVPTKEEALAAAAQRIEEALSGLKISTRESGPEDESWYWAAPVLLDLQADRRRTLEWFSPQLLAESWTGESGADDGVEEDSLWSSHVEHARSLLERAGAARLGRRPADLAVMLAKLGTAGPAVCALRALTRVAGGPGSLNNFAVRMNAAQVGWAFRHLFNLPETTALLRGSGRAEENAYWRLVLDYCVDGGLQSCLDEYAHVLRESLGLLDAQPEEVAAEVSTVMREALSLKASSAGVDEIKPEPARARVVVNDRRMRGHFALRFGEEKTDDDRGLNRAEQVRTAFNSPFWPFVLATTSVGQEGLDFHHYCHAVVHWNLPANPVDLEQREGRVHRYKGHAVRKNVADAHGFRAESFDGAHDPWQAMFEAARGARGPGDSDLVPYWVYPRRNGAAIERHVPALPLSRDAERYSALRRSLAVYRMVFGQSRQEEMAAYLLSNLSPEERLSLTSELRINLEPPRAGIHIPSTELH